MVKIKEIKGKKKKVVVREIKKEEEVDEMEEAGEYSEEFEVSRGVPVVLGSGEGGVAEAPTPVRNVTEDLVAEEAREEERLYGVAGEESSGGTYTARPEERLIPIGSQGGAGLIREPALRRQSAMGIQDERAEREETKYSEIKEVKPAGRRGRWAGGG